MITTNNQLKAFIAAIALISIGVFSWEMYLRSKDLHPAYNDGPEAWAHIRKEANLPKEKTTVFIGSSRIKFDLDLETWKEITGDHPVQLACVGSSPIPALNHLAQDSMFKGKLIVDVTEPLFFSFDSDKRPNAGIKYFKEETYAQWASYYIDFFLQSKFILLDKENFSLNAMIDKWPIPMRKGVDPPIFFPVEFERVNAERQAMMTDRFASDTSQTKIVKDLWKLFGDFAKKAPPTPPQKIDSLIVDIKIQTDKIKSRGGEVIFVRTPSSGPLYEGEKMGFPRDKYWQRLLDSTHCQGIHFADYPDLASLICPENSHLNQSDAKFFTRKFIDILRTQIGWKLESKI